MVRLSTSPSSRFRRGCADSSSRQADAYDAHTSLPRRCDTVYSERSLKHPVVMEPFLAYRPTPMDARKLSKLPNMVYGSLSSGFLTRSAWAVAGSSLLSRILPLLPLLRRSSTPWKSLADWTSTARSTRSIRALDMPPPLLSEFFAAWSVKRQHIRSSAARSSRCSSS